LFFNLAPGLVAAPGISKVYSCAWSGALNGFWLKVTWRRYSTFHFSVCTTGVMHHGRKGRRWHPYRHIFLNLSSWLGFNRTKVSISTKKTGNRGRHRGPRDPRWRPRWSSFFVETRSFFLGFVSTFLWKRGLFCGDEVLFFVETDAQVRLKPSHELRFWKMRR